MAVGGGDYEYEEGDMGGRANSGGVIGGAVLVLVDGPEGREKGGLAS